MRLVVQRVSEASCQVDGQLTGQIGKGFMVLAGFGQGDDQAVVEKMAVKLSKLRVFEDGQGKMNLSLFEAGGDVLSISQFTLYADAAKGNRPSFAKALSGPDAIGLYQYFNECLRGLGLKVEEGIFGADMKVSLVNDGPVTIILDSEDLW